MRQYIFVCSILLFPTFVFGADYFRLKNETSIHDSIQISLLTYSPAAEIYALFGHSSIRVQNKNNGTDIVYNYGTFNFDQPNFYVNFIQGNLQYQLSSGSFNRELSQTQREARRLIETPLILTLREKESILELLHENMKPENRYYTYNFLYDNCATRINDILQRTITDSLILRTEVIPYKTFRQLIHDYIGIRPWVQLGTDILMGTPVDKIPEHTQSAFLPDYLHIIIKNYYTANPPRNKSITRADNLLLKNFTKLKPVRLTPTIVFLIFSALFLISGVIDSYFRNIFNALGNIQILICGTLSLMLLYLWLATNHYIFRWNIDLLWINPLLIILFIFRRKPSTVMLNISRICLSLGIIGMITTLLVQHSYPASSAALALNIHLFFIQQKLKIELRF